MIVRNYSDFHIHIHLIKKGTGIVVHTSSLQTGEEDGYVFEKIAQPPELEQNYRYGFFVNARRCNIINDIFTKPTKGISASDRTALIEIDDSYSLIVSKDLLVINPNVKVENKCGFDFYAFLLADNSEKPHRQERVDSGTTSNHLYLHTKDNTATHISPQKKFSDLHHPHSTKLTIHSRDFEPVPDIDETCLRCIKKVDTNITFYAFQV